MKTIYFILISILCITGFADSVENRPNVKVLSRKPRIYLLEKFLSSKECDYIIAEAKDKLVRSAVIDPETGEDSIDDVRTSYGMDFQYHQDPILTNIENRIASYTQVPVEYGEALQVLNYGVGAEFIPHHDYFERDCPGHVIHLEQQGQRLATLIMYLNTVEDGGETIFPEAKVVVKPIKGNAVLFYNCTPDGKEDPLTLHAGTPVHKGEKWIVTKWLRERPYFEQSQITQSEKAP